MITDTGHDYCLKINLMRAGLKRPSQNVLRLIIQAVHNSHTIAITLLMYFNLYHEI